MLWQPSLPERYLNASEAELGATIEARVASLIRGADRPGFDVVRYAQKANSNLAILGLMRRAGARLDAVSAGEVARALAAGFAPRDVVFTADLFDAAALATLARSDSARET